MDYTPISPFIVEEKVGKNVTPKAWWKVSPGLITINPAQLNLSCSLLWIILKLSTDINFIFAYSSKDKILFKTKKLLLLHWKEIKIKL